MSKADVSYYDWQMSFKDESEKDQNSNDKNLNSLGISDLEFKDLLKKWKNKNLN